MQNLHGKDRTRWPRSLHIGSSLRVRHPWRTRGQYDPDEARFDRSHGMQCMNRWQLSNPNKYPDQGDNRYQHRDPE